MDYKSLRPPFCEVQPSHFSMDADNFTIPPEESELLSTLLVSIPAVLKHSGAQGDMNYIMYFPKDMDYIMYFLKEAVIYRGLSPLSQKLLVDLHGPLSKFKNCFISSEKLEDNLLRIVSDLNIQLHTSNENKVGGFFPLSS